MKSRKIGILTAGALVVGALALMTFRGFLVGEVVYPVERLVRLVRHPVRDEARAEARALALMRGDLERLRVENARLRRALEYKARQPQIWLSAGVLSSGGGASATHCSIRVDKGSLDGVKEGAVVVVPEGLVGRVAEVSPHTAVVALISDPSVKVSCAVQEGASDRAYGILSGGGPDGLQLRHLDPAGRLRPPAKVVTSGLGGVFPRGLAVGTLGMVTNDVRGVVGEVRPCVEFSTLEDVFIRRDQ